MESKITINNKDNSLTNKEKVLLSQAIFKNTTNTGIAKISNTGNFLIDTFQKLQGFDFRWTSLITNEPLLFEDLNYYHIKKFINNTITDNQLYVNADKFTPVDSTYMTTGEILPVAGTPMDFTKPKAIGQDINKFDYVQLKNGNGYDHNWVLNTAGDITKLAAKLTSPISGITLEMYTDEPGVQVYTGNFLDGKVKGKHGIVYKQRTGVCLETQHYPDSPNKKDWPSVILEPGKTYKSHCIYKFSVAK